MRTPDFSLDFRQDGDVDHYRLTLAQAAAVDFRVPVRAEQVRRVTLNGQETKWSAEAGFGCTQVIVSTGKLAVVDVMIEVAARVPHTAPVVVAGKVGEQVRLEVARGRVVSWQDLHGAIDSHGKGMATLAGPCQTSRGTTWCWLPSKLVTCRSSTCSRCKSRDPEGDAKAARLKLRVNGAAIRALGMS